MILPPSGEEWQKGDVKRAAFYRAFGRHLVQAIRGAFLAAVEELKTRGVVFEEYGVPGLATVDGLAEIPDNYPSKGGVGERAAWFKDSEGNLLAIGQPILRS